MDGKLRCRPPCYLKPVDPPPPPGRSPHPALTRLACIGEAESWASAPPLIPHPDCARSCQTDRQQPALHRRHEAHTTAHTPSPARLGMEQQADGPLLTPRCPEATFRPGGGKAPSRSQHHPDICARKPGLGHSAWHSAPRLRTTRLPPVLCGRGLPPPSLACRGLTGGRRRPRAPAAATTGR